MSLAEAVNEIGLRLFQQLSAQSPASDVVVSPLSIKTCMSMVSEGATEGSPNEQELAEVLGPKMPAPSKDAAFDMANSAWVRGAIKQEYVQRVRSLFKADAVPLEGTDPTPINRWVEAKTQGRIAQLFKSLHPNTVMVLVNTVFFKGSWSDPFDKADTKASDFRGFSGAVPCQMMYKKDKKMNYYEDGSGAQAVRLPYSAGGLSATILLPKEEGPEALGAAVGGLTSKSWATLHHGLQSSHKHVELHLPQFAVSFGSQLTDAFKALGMREAFDGRGGFLRMSDDPEVHIDVVMHKATIEVNEEGTVASAATGAVMARRSLPLPAVPMTVDRPFLFFISDQEGALIFLAKVVEPSKPSDRAAAQPSKPSSGGAARKSHACGCVCA